MVNTNNLTDIENLIDKKTDPLKGQIIQLQTELLAIKKTLNIQHVSVSLFNEALRVMRDLAEHQNGAPLMRHEEEYNNTMTEVWDFLEANETE